MSAISELHARLQSRKTLLGCAIDSGDASTVELAGRLGFDIVWGDLEHGSASHHEAQWFCQAAKAGNALALLRIQSAERTHVLRALEVGAALVVVPMVNDPETARRVAEHGKYAPLGNRGFAASSRGLQYGVGDAIENMAWANRETHLFVQIETAEAVRRCAEIVAAKGITGGAIGPADLSLSMGKPLAFDSPAIVDACCRAVRDILGQGKIAMVVTGNPTLLRATAEAGAQIFICASERSSLRVQWQQVLREVSALAKRAETPA